MSFHEYNFHLYSWFLLIRWARISSMDVFTMKIHVSVPREKIVFLGSYFVFGINNVFVPEGRKGLI